MLQCHLLKKSFLLCSYTALNRNAASSYYCHWRPSVRIRDSYHFLPFDLWHISSTSWKEMVPLSPKTQFLPKVRKERCLFPHAIQTVPSLCGRPIMDPRGHLSPLFAQRAVCFYIAGAQIHPEDNQVFKFSMEQCWSKRCTSSINRKAAHICEFPWGGLANYTSTIIHPCTRISEQVSSRGQVERTSQTTRREQQRELGKYEKKSYETGINPHRLCCEWTFPAAEQTCFPRGLIATH